ncbi:Mpo1-like protein [Acinetobacter sp. B51(2017)]|uniref:Mpo1 family 2-hydroxy fatty acid dioxygenase n=1 Tax=Acinetobacter sp. B51(2017) TaxID=2060938 RepID=UPI000F085CFE|nr:Mpo1-like protein [Acinetobacter sp. B51(2017)]
MRHLQDWLDEYNQNHQHPLNKKIHWLCVPSIYFAIVAIVAHFSWLLACVLLVLSFMFYARLDMLLACAMAILNIVLLALIYSLPVGFGFYLSIFILAWLGQFYGHSIEGKKPSFFKDLQFLLIGPIWCLDSLLGKAGFKWKTRQKSQMVRI